MLPLCCYCVVCLIILPCSTWLQATCDIIDATRGCFDFMNHVPCAIGDLTCALCPSAMCPMPSAMCPVPSAMCPVPAVICPLPSALFLLPFALCLLPCALYPLPSANCPVLLPSAMFCHSAIMSADSCVPARLQSKASGRFWSDADTQAFKQWRPVPSGLFRSRIWTFWWIYTQSWLSPCKMASSNIFRTSISACPALNGTPHGCSQFLPKLGIIV